jgi:L-2-hydroxyglutarate oxidase LhgO
VTFREVDEIAAMVGDTDIGLTLTRGTMVILDKAASHWVQNMVYGTYGPDHSQLITPTAHGNLLIGLGYFDAPRHKNDTIVTKGENLNVKPTANHESRNFNRSQ